jgi:dihydroorotase
VREFILYGGMIVSDSEVVAADLWVADGKVAGWLAPGAGEKLAAARPGVRLISANGLYILPGLIDVHVHLREPGLEHKEDFVSGTEAAALGGVTTVLDMPNTIPPVTGPKELQDKMAKAEGRLTVDVGFYGVVGRDNLDAIEDLAAAGAVAFKMFLGPTTGEIRPPEHGALFAAFEEVARTGLPLVVHAEDREVIEYWQNRLAGLGDTYGHFLQSRPAYGEAAATELAIRLAEATGARVHIAHVATAEGVDVLRAAKERCEYVTCETCPHYLTLTEADWPRLGNKLKILPPVRSTKDQKRLWEAVQDGVIDVIATDHAPHLDAERTGKSLWDAPAGAAGLETMLPLLLDSVNRGRLTLPDVVRLTSERPAEIFGLAPRKGSLRPGADADLVLVDLMQRRVLRGEALRTRAKSTPFEGMEVQGVPVATYLRGELVASQGDLVSTARRGRVLTPGSR